MIKSDGGEETLTRYWAVHQLHSLAISGEDRGKRASGVADYITVPGNINTSNEGHNTKMGETRRFGRSSFVFQGSSGLKIGYQMISNGDQ